MGDDLRLESHVRRALSALLALAVLIGVGGAATAPAAAEPARIISGWLPYWMTTPGSPAGVTNAVNNAGLISEVSPFWYSATAGGPAGVQVKLNPNFSNGPANVSWAMAQLRGAGLTVVPAIADASGKGRMAATLADPGKRAAHIADIVALVTTNGFDGIDLDYEVFAFTDGRASWAATQPKWTAFVTELGAALHAQGKMLTVTIPPPCTTANVCGPQSGYWVYDLAGIAPAADRIRIMAYDFHVSSAGPIAPISWVRAIVAYSAPVVTPGKLQIGVPTYGRAWTKKDGGKYQLSGTCPTGGAAYQALTARASVNDANIPATLAQNGVDPAAVQWDPVSAENWVEYDKKVTWTDSSGATQTCIARRVMWWVGPQAVAERVKLVPEFGLAGAALWTIGGDSPEQWPLIAAVAGGMAPAPAAVQAAIPATVLFGQPLNVSATVTVNGAPVAGATAQLQTKRASQRKWRTIASAQTAADGTVGFAPVADRPGSWRVFVPGTADRAAQASDPVPVLVSSWVRARPRKATLAPGATTTVRVVSMPARRAQPVVVQVQRGDAWVTVARGRTDARGVAKVTIRAPKAAGTYAHRAVGLPKAGFAQGASDPFVIAVG